MEDNTNINRMSRQQEFLSSLMDAFEEKSKSDDDFILDASLAVSEYMVSNYTVNQLENLIKSLSNYEFKGIYKIDGVSKVGEKLVLDLFYVKNDI